MVFGATQLGKRLLSSAGLVTVTLLAIFVAPHWLFFAVVLTIILIGVYEFLTIVQRKGIMANRPLGMLFAALIPFSIESQAFSFVMVLAVLSLLVFHFRQDMKKHALLGTAVVIFSLVYISWFMSHLILIRKMDHGALWVFYIILLVKGGDSGAYFIGKRFGKRKLIEHISPNKSVEGAIAGLATSVILSIVCSFFFPAISMFQFVVLGLILGILAQLGDLGESVLKRDVGIKDSGHVPGLGGILDVLDSLILTVPFLYYYMIFVLRIL